MERLLWLPVLALIVAIAINYFDTYGKKGRRDIF
jgi:hypothetical protein